MYLAVLKHGLRPTQIGMAADIREQITRVVGTGPMPGDFEDQVISFVKKYSTILRRSEHEKATDSKEGRLSKTNKKGRKKKG
jgi:hypothetical protein